ncbi:MAG TPA: hypothetical protein DD737_06020 [Ruminococcaceae bacterium]|jgi:hypothetical protein|nr:hypothetical protein [Oscillospiraceae bacterium]HCB90427.1 hypothetical protein [Oscillospiraceae bacterium]
MVHEKRIGEYCNYLKQFVPVRYRYFPDSSSEKTCENSTCGNSRCCLCDSFTGNRDTGKDFLGQPKPGSE